MFRHILAVSGRLFTDPRSRVKVALLILLFAVIPVTEMLAVRLFSGIITDGPGQFVENPRRVVWQIVVFFLALGATRSAHQAPCGSGSDCEISLSEPAVGSLWLCSAFGMGPLRRRGRGGRGSRCRCTSGWDPVRRRRSACPCRRAAPHGRRRTIDHRMEGVVGTELRIRGDVAEYVIRFLSEVG